MITTIQTHDGRVLMTDRDDIESVLKEAREDGVDLGENEDVFNEMDQTNRSYVLVSQDWLKVETACRPAN